MPTADRLLNLLSLFMSRPQWSAEELADRLEITERTVRRDVTRLREIGYPIDSVTGINGGYRLGAGGKLPPLLLDDDEAVAMAIGLGATLGSEGLADAAVSALAKLDRVLPPRLRERVAALRQVTLGVRRSGVPAFETDALVLLAVACQRPERLRFEYRANDDRVTQRYVEPFRLVFTARSWYLVAFDRDRDDWRTFRVDRMSDLRPTGTTFTRGEVPDALAQVSEGIAVRGYEMVATVRIHAPSRRRGAVVVADGRGDRPRGRRRHHDRADGRRPRLARPLPRERRGADRGPRPTGGPGRAARAGQAAAPRAPGLRRHVSSNTA